VCARLRGARPTARGGETPMSGMKRREFITLLGGAARSLAARGESAAGRVNAAAGASESY